MDRDRMGRWMLWCGPASLAALIAAAVVSRPFGNLPDPETVVEQARERRIPMLLGSWLQSLAGAMLIVFSVGLWARLRDAEGAPAVASSLALAGGAASGAMVMVSASAVAAVAERGGRPGSTAESAAASVDLSNMLMGSATPISLAVATGATTVVAARTGVLPRWLQAASGGLTVGMLSPVSFVFVVGGFIWVAVVGAILGRERSLSGNRTT